MVLNRESFRNYIKPRNNKKGYYASTLRGSIDSSSGVLPGLASFCLKGGELF